MNQARADAAGPLGKHDGHDYQSAGAGGAAVLQMITLGGDAELELVDSLDPFSEVSCSLCFLGRFWLHMAQSHATYLGCRLLPHNRLSAFSLW